MPASKSKALPKAKATDIEKIVVQLANEGNSPAKIGLILRDLHGVPRAKIAGKKVTKILDENHIVYEKEKDILEKKVENIKNHLKKNKHDYTAGRSLTKKLWRIQKVNKA